MNSINKLDAIVSDFLIRENLTIGVLIHQLGWSRRTWKRYLKSPGNFRVDDLKQISITLGIPFLDLMKAVDDSLENSLNKELFQSS